ncbi:MAG: hypothetical protein JNK82_44585 [Myxococcaceae bacterium]|nr:hypothetical protein [Myxococcaceae bacterium]
MTALLIATLFAADGGTTTLYTVAITEPHGLLQLELKTGGASGKYKQVVSIHLPPAEVDVLDVKVTAKGDALCLEPQPKAIEPCLTKKGDGLEATLKRSKTKVVLEKR